MKVCHLTSVHPRYDTRIFLKQSRSLAAAGYDVTLVVADGKGNEIRDGVQIIDVGASRSRIDRVMNATRRIKRVAGKIGADLYHLHDPELLFVGLSLKRRGKRVIFDSHEDIPQDILTKAYIPKAIRRPSSRISEAGLKTICDRLDAVIAATPHIRDTFLRKGIRSVDINNFPILGELSSHLADAAKHREVCYVGGLAEIRGIVELVKAMELVKSGARLTIAGAVHGSDVEHIITSERGWQNVNAAGHVSRTEVRDILSRSVAGIVTFKPGPNHLESQPNKMFEYMSAGVPVIASNFSLWREIVEGNECGLSVDPLDPAAIAAAIDWLVGNPDLAHRMGENGRQAVMKRYNWSVEEAKLLDFYEEISCNSSKSSVPKRYRM